MSAPWDALIERAGLHQLPPDAPRGNVQVLLHLEAGQQAIGALYDGLLEAASPEARLLGRMLRRDWELRIQPVLESGRMLLEQLKASTGRPVSPLPPPDAGPLASALAAAEAGSLLRGAHAFAARALGSVELVPWVSNLLEVSDHFRACVEAEDAHIGLLETLLELAA